MNFLEKRVPPLFVVLILAVLMWFIAAVSDKLLLSGIIRYGISALLLIAGVLIVVAGAIAFRKANTTVNPLHPEDTSSLVTSGVYRVTRNPMYVGFGLFVLAWAVYLDALLPFIGVPVYIAYIQRFQIKPEEKELEKLFGETFIDYKKRVRMWL